VLHDTTSAPDAEQAAHPPPDDEATFSQILDRLAATRYTPLATYRVQFNRTFRFDDARQCAAYLAKLGVSDLYASPYLKANPGSSHGYDIIDHHRLNPEIGSEAEYDRFVDTLHKHGLHQLLDIVPNHMGIGSGNTWWLDVLENGPSSPYAGFFDIDWQPPKPEMTHRVLLPILGDQFGRVLERGELRLAFESGAFTVHYYEHTLPVAPDTYTLILQPALARVATMLPAENEQLLELESIITAIGHLPPTTAAGLKRRAERQRERLVVRRRLQELCEESSAVCDAIVATVKELNGDAAVQEGSEDCEGAGAPARFDRLADLLDRQPYRLSYWRVAAEEINYRRFFDVNSLAALRMERPEVFAATHQLILKLLVEGKVNGIRVDHPDGLRDPCGYLQRLQEQYLVGHVASARGAGSVEEESLIGRFEQFVQGHPEDTRLRPLYVVVEKILGHGERLPPNWLVDGTTGYEYLNALNGILVDSANRKAFDALYTAFIGKKVVFRDLVYETKKLITSAMLASELNLLALQLSRVAARNRLYRDFTLNALRAALAEVIACFPIYRTYIEKAGEAAKRGDRISERDHLYVDLAIARAKRLNPVTDPSIFQFIEDTLTFAGAGRGDDDAQTDFVLKFQQVSGPVMAKGVEDTAFYVYNRLASLNEVGGDPEQFGISLTAFHRQNAERQSRWPHAMLATSTHDTKRSEDVRARINVLSELPNEWRAAIGRWSRLNRKHKQTVRGQPYPDKNDEYLLYQTLLGAWPLESLTECGAEGHRAFVERIQAYMEKAVREAKVHTSWISPDATYEDALHAFIAAILTGPAHNPFVQDALPFFRRVARCGLYNSLTQTLLKLTSPGVPDIYQGAELWDFSLVDPDNRRPVDFYKRARLLAELQQTGDGMGRQRAVSELLRHKEDGRIKLLLTQRVLQFRQGHRRLYGTEGAYVPVELEGDRHAHAVAFLRRNGKGAAVTVVPRLLAQMVKSGIEPVAGAWGNTTLLLRGEPPGASYRDVFTGAVLTSAVRLPVRSSLVGKAANQGKAAADGKNSNEGLGVAMLPLAEVFTTLPCALLERVEG